MKGTRPRVGSNELSGAALQVERNSQRIFTASD